MELLAPAGTLNIGLTALDAGADAVYAGLDKFNARERGRNFSIEDLSKLVAYAHKNSKRVYVTLNTLIKQNELQEAAKLLSDITAIRPDAVIVQDLGLLNLIREYFPELEIHASTQMGIHNSAGVILAESLGIQRVILERQITLEEMEEIKNNTSVELEVFVHGALCCSRSGECLFSSWMGGWSGNRGKCKQPCRRRYYSEDGNGFFFSTQDLYSLEAIPQLRNLGISSLKIEGRLRKGDYVRNVVTAYRMMLDAPENEFNQRLKEARNVLSGALGRKWHQPFYSESNMSDVIQHKSLGASGLICGSVIDVSDNGFLADISRPLKTGDNIRIQPGSGDEGPSLTITRMSINKRNVNSATAGDKCWISCDKPVEKKSRIFKLGHQNPDTADRAPSLPLSRIPLDLHLKITENSLSVQSRFINWQQMLEIQPAQKHALTEMKLIDEFNKTRSDKFKTGSVTAELPDNIFVPASVLKDLRRTFWEAADSQIAESDVIDELKQRVSDINSDLPIDLLQQEPVQTVKLKQNKMSSKPDGLIAMSIYEYTDEAEELVLPEFCPESDLAELKELIKTALQSGIKRFRITSIYSFQLFKDIEDVTLTAGFPLPVCNSMAINELLSLGAQKATAWVELEQDSLDELAEKAGSALEIFSYGRIPILTTRMKIPAEGKINDARGAVFNLLKERHSTYLLPEKAMSIPAVKGLPTFIDLTFGEPGEEVSAFNLDRNLV